MGEKENYLRIPITMPAEMVEGLEALSLKAKYYWRQKLTNTELARAAINVLLESGLAVVAIVAKLTGFGVVDTATFNKL